MIAAVAANRLAVDEFAHGLAVSSRGSRNPPCAPIAYISAGGSSGAAGVSGVIDLAR